MLAGQGERSHRDLRCGYHAEANEEICGGLLGMTVAELNALQEEGVI